MEEQVSVSEHPMERAPIDQSGMRSEPRGHDTGHPVDVGVPRWTVVTAGAAPALLVVGFLVAAMLQPSYDSLRDTIQRVGRPRLSRPLGHDGRNRVSWCLLSGDRPWVESGAAYRPSCPGGRGRGDIVYCRLSDTASWLFVGTRCGGDRRLHNHVCVADTGRPPTTPSTGAEDRSQCCRLSGHLRSDHVVHVRDQRRGTRPRRALCRGCACALALPGCVWSSPNSCSWGSPTQWGGSSCRGTASRLRVRVSPSNSDLTTKAARKITERELQASWHRRSRSSSRSSRLANPRGEKSL